MALDMKERYAWGNIRCMRGVVVDCKSIKKVYSIIFVGTQRQTHVYFREVLYLTFPT